MRYLLIIPFILLTLNSFSQVDFKSTIFIENKRNFDISFFSKLKFEKDVTKYSFIAKIVDFGKYQDYSDLVPQITSTKSEYYTTAFSFIINENKDTIYRYPINDKKFNNKYFYKYIYPVLITNPKVKINITIYKTDSIPVIVIDCIKLVDQ